MSVFDHVMSVSESDGEDSDRGEVSEYSDIEERSKISDMEEISEHIVVRRVRLEQTLPWFKVGGRSGGSEKRHFGARKESFDVLIPSDSEDDADLQIPGIEASKVFMDNNVKIVDENELGSTSPIIIFNVLRMSDTEEEDTDVEDFQMTSSVTGWMKEAEVTGGKYGDRNNNMGGGRMEMHWEEWESELDGSGVDDSDLEISGIEKLDMSTDGDNNEISPAPRSSIDSSPDLLSLPSSLHSLDTSKAIPGQLAQLTSETSVLESKHQESFTAPKFKLSKNEFLAALGLYSFEDVQCKMREQEDRRSQLRVDCKPRLTRSAVRKMKQSSGGGGQTAGAERRQGAVNKGSGKKGRRKRRRG